MILVGQYDSPFVRRVAVSLHLYGLPFERNRLSVFKPQMAEIHPLTRIPSLITDEGETLIDSAAILDYVDELVGPERALTPRSGEERRRVLQTVVVAAGAVEKAGAVVYERHLHPPEAVAQDWVARCGSQLAGALAHLEAHAGEPWYFGAKLTQADVMTGCLLLYLGLRLPEAFPPGRYPKLARLAEACEALEAFKQSLPAPDEVMPAKV
ncbi:MAG: glutathione S-transferase family protein [Candidatus Rokubacteria bacterium]|nr:glutathione S-transferase family protein [Candidatus Rokubacteria bacterium]